MNDMLMSEYGLDPQGRLRFYGIYSGRVVDVNDPLKKGRIKVQVPQTTGTEALAWASPAIGGLAEVNYPYGTFARTSNQTMSANTATAIVFNKTEDTGGGLALGTDASRILITETGDYFLQFSAVFSKSSASNSSVDVWIRKNGVDLPRSNTRIQVSGNPGDQVMTVCLILDLKAKDYIQLYMSSSDANMKLTAYTGLTTPTRPDIPAIIATLNMVGNFTPRVGTNVWVTFVAGDPEYPVWIGTQS